MSNHGNVEGLQGVNTVPAQDGVPETPITISPHTSGYGSLEGVQVFSELQSYNHQLVPLHLMSNYSPLLVHHPVSGTSHLPLLHTNAAHGNQMIPTHPLPVGHPYTAPIMVTTSDPLQLSLMQQPAPSSQDQVHISPHYRQRQYSGPVVVATPTNYDQKLVVPPSCQTIADSGEKSSLEIQHGDIPGTYNQPMSYRVYQAPQLSSNVMTPIPAREVHDRSASLVTQSLRDFNENKAEPNLSRRSTTPCISFADSERRETLKRVASSVKKAKSLCEKDEDESLPSVIVGEDFGGYEHQFLVSPEELQEITCPICQLVLCEPFLTTCCGTHFCHSCVFPVLRGRRICPLCNNTDLQGIVDRRTERKINSLPVKCSQSESGCKWTGSLNDLQTHLSPSSGDCKFVIVPCPLDCGEQLPLSELKEHETNSCRRRIHQCKFCSYKGIYEDIPTHHWPVCEGYPTKCPNDCPANDMPRRKINEHLALCPKRRVQCSFSYAGCSTTLYGNELHQHMEECTSLHLELLSGMVKTLLTVREYQSTNMPSHMNSKTDTERNTEIVILNRKLNEKEEEISSLKHQMNAIQEDAEEMKLDIARMKSTLCVPPCKFDIMNFSELKDSSKQWFSNPFYSHQHGYKMCISVDCDGADEGEGTHVSVYANLMRGEFDEALSWPFSGAITIQLLNQMSDKSHIVHNVPFGRNVALEIAGRVVDQELAISGLGVPQFIHHSMLVYDRHANTEYLKDDCLKFCVLRVKINT